MNETAGTEAAFPSVWPSKSVQQAKHSRKRSHCEKEHQQVRKKRHSPAVPKMLMAVFSKCWGFNLCLLSSLHFYMVTIISQLVCNFYIIRNYIKLFLQ